MKACIICPDEKNYMPYIAKYTTFFDENAVEYDVLYRYHEAAPEGVAANEFCFFEVGKEEAFDSFFTSFRYKKFILAILQEKNYDRIIVISTELALLLKKQLHTYYEHRYLFDYRGYTFEKFLPYKKAVDKLIEDSLFSTVSSHGFLDFISGNKKIILNHSILGEKSSEPPQDIKDKAVLNIGYIGKVRCDDENCILLSKLKNEFRYQLWYMGKPVTENRLDSFCTANGITNASFVGKFMNAHKKELYKNMDIINAVFSDDTPSDSHMLPARLYDACLLKKPIIASKNTFLGEIVEQYNIGLAIDIEHDDILMLLNEYVESFDIEEFNAGCEEFLADVKIDEDSFASAMRQFIKIKKVKKKK